MPRWGFRGVFVLKSGLKILIRAHEVLFLVAPKTPEMGHFGCLGPISGVLVGTKNGT